MINLWFLVFSCGDEVGIFLGELKSLNKIMFKWMFILLYTEIGLVGVRGRVKVFFSKYL